MSNRRLAGALRLERAGRGRQRRRALVEVFEIVMPWSKLKHHLTPTATMLVSRAWVMREVEQVPDLSGAERQRLVDLLCAWEPPRNNGLRTNIIAWVCMLGMAMLFGALGLPGWLGFLVAMGGLAAVARVLVMRQLRWKLAQLLRERAARANARAAT
ncbi:MAG: hypothetical protein ING59_19675 [Burkholderiales bacterium]|nr:hypothetical protein [Burkholderiales bacterium]